MMLKIFHNHNYLCLTKFVLFLGICVAGYPFSCALANSVKSSHASHHKKWLVYAKKIQKLPVDKGGSCHHIVQVGAVIVDKNQNVLAFSGNRTPKKLANFF